MQSDDIMFNKAAIIERCIQRIRAEYHADPEFADQTRIDALTLNIERACQAAIDLAMHVVASQHLGMPQSSADAFVHLEKHGLIESRLTKQLRAMTGFRNIAIHEYQALDLAVLRWIAKEGWKDWIQFCTRLGIHIRNEFSG